MCEWNTMYMAMNHPTSSSNPVNLLLTIFIMAVFA